MTSLNEIAPAFVDMAHRIVWATVATVDPQGRPRTRILHPIWQWDGERLEGWIATGPTPVKRAHLAAQRDVSLSYWAPTHDTCSAECHTEWHFDDETRIWLWEKFKKTPQPVGYDPAIIPPWAGGPTSAAFAALRLTPTRLRVMAGEVMTAGVGAVLTWQAPSS